MEKAVKNLQPKVEQLRKVSVDVVRDLWIAHAALAQRGGDRRSEDAQTFGFCDFLELVGLSKKMAYLWSAPQLLDTLTRLILRTDT